MSLAFRHTATLRLAEGTSEGTDGSADPATVRVQAADVTLADPAFGHPEVQNDPRTPYFERVQGQGSLARFDVLEAIGRTTSQGAFLGPEPDPATPRPEWRRWFAATDMESSVTLRGGDQTRGPVPIRWSGTPLGTTPPGTDDLSPHFYVQGRAGLGRRAIPASGPLWVRPESLIDLSGPMVLLFRPASLPVGLIPPTRQLAGVETIDGVEVARVAWLVDHEQGNQGLGVRGLAWVAPGLGFAVVRFEATTSSEGGIGSRTSWRRDSSGYRRVGDLWLPDRVEYHAETRQPGGARTRRLDLIATFEDYRIDTEVPADAFRPKLTIGALDAQSGAFTAEAPVVPDGLVQRLKQAVAASPFGPPRSTGLPFGSGMVGMGGGTTPRGAGPAASATAPAPTPATPRPAPAGPASAGGPAEATAASRPEAAPPQPSPALLKARRDTQAAEVARAEAGLRVAESLVARNVSLNKRLPNSVSREEIQKAEAEYSVAKATVDREKGRLAEADLLLAEAKPVAVDRATPGVLKARRDAQAAELARAEVGLKLAQTVAARNDSLNKQVPNTVSREALQKAEAEFLTARATVDRERARLAEADALIAESSPASAARADDRAVPGVLKARRDAQAAEVARAKAGLRIIQIKFANVSRLASGPNPAVSQNEVELLRGEVDMAQAAVDRERARLTEVDVLLAEARANPAEGHAADSVASTSVPSPSRTLADLRDLAELLDLQIKGKRGEVEFARATADRATSLLNDRQKLLQSNALGRTEFRETEQAAAKARADLLTREIESSQLELRFKQTKARIDLETANLRRQADEAKLRLDWSRSMLAKGYVSRTSFRKDRAEYDGLMLQLDPSYRPEPEPEPVPGPAMPPPPPAAPPSGS